MSERDADDATAATKREGQERTTVDPRPPSEAEGEERLARGTLVGRYVVSHVLGAGGMGVVYSAFDPELDRKVAIKLLQAMPGGSESGGQTWLLREAQAMARLAHPNVVAVYDVGAIPGDRVFVAMELIEGITLRVWQRQKHTWRETVAVLRAAGTGLAAAHAAGLVHRDFKPDNVLVGNDGRVRVMDFGLARLHGTDEPAARTSDLQIESKSPLSERLTATGAVLGTPAYMAPEIYGGHAADAHADQFAFGVALYEALYRVRPFDRKDLVAQRAVAPKPPASKVPAWLERVVLRAVALDPAERFATMDELLAELAKDPTAGRRRIAIGAAVAVVCGGAVVGAFAMRGERAPANDACIGAAAKLAGNWDAATRSALEAAFHKVKKPFVDDTIRGTEKTLDAYAADWVTMRTDACKATHAGYQTADVLTLRMECLDTRLVELKTLVGLFAAADEPLVLGAVTAAQKLSPLAECADTTALLVPDPLPKDPKARQEVTAFKGKLAEARVMNKASRPKDALAITNAIAADVTRVAHKPTEAEMHLLTGEFLWVVQGAAKGEPELMKAVFAAEAGKADEIKVEAWIALTNLAIEQSHWDVAMERLQQASAALARLGTSWDLKVRVLDSQALLDSRQNKYDSALAAAKEARVVAEKHTDATTAGYALLVEASILNSAAHAQEALDDFKKILASEDALGHRRIEVAVTLSSMATAELQVGKFADAVAHTKSSLEITEAIYGPDTSEVARVLSTLGAAQSMSGDLAGSLATDQKALAMTAKTLGEDTEQYAMILGQLADSLVTLKRTKEALPYLDRALAIQTAKLGPGHVQTLTIVLTKCDALHSIDKLKDAIAVCEQALASAEKSLGHDSPILFIFLGHLGEVYLDAKQSKKAVATLERALKLGATDPSDVYYIALLDARALWDTGDHKRAIELATKARDGFTKLGDTKKEQAKDADDWLKKHQR